jgi:hypothetical protein
MPNVDDMREGARDTIVPRAYGAPVAKDCVTVIWQPPCAGTAERGSALGALRRDRRLPRIDNRHPLHVDACDA